MAESKSYTPSPKYAKIFEGGTLYLRKDGYLIFQKYETDENDKYRRVTFTGKTEEQVAKKYKEFLKRVKEIRGQRQQEAYRMLAGVPLGLKPPAGIDIDISLSDWVLYFIQTYKTPPSVKRTTYSSYMQTYQTQILPFFGQTPLNKVTDADMQTYLNFLQTNGRLDRKGGLSPKSIYNIFVVLNAALEKARGKIIINREVPFYEYVFGPLMAYKQVQAGSGQPNPQNLLFPTRKGTYTDPRTYPKRVQAVCKRCELQGVNVHALRHTFATRLMEQNVPIRIIQNLMGHASIVTTEKYSHVLDDEKRKAIDRMSGFLPETEKPERDTPQ